jgi:isocitrate/isopropylmalate dehydrogenase
MAKATEKTGKKPNAYKIAVIPGDGIGNEVVPEGIKVLEAVARKFDIAFEWDHFDWSCEVFKKTGKMMPDDGLDRIRNHDAIYLGAVGFPGVPDHVSLWGLLIPIRRNFQQYINRVLCASSKASRGRSQTASRATSTTSSCARTTRASIPLSAGACMRVATTR